MKNSLMSKVLNLETKLSKLTSRLSGLGSDTKNIVTSQLRKNNRMNHQPSMFIGLYMALCVATDDPLQLGRIRFYTPFMSDDDVPTEGLPWAWPISPFGGFDDSGVTWVPPAGSTVAVLFERGSRYAPFYIGTVWHKFRGAQGDTVFGRDMKEYYKIHNGHRKGYIVGANDESQVLPPWNTENYNAYDHDSSNDYEEDTNAKKNSTYAHIYGMKTPQKHSIKMVDGNYKCNHKYKRFEIISSCGGFMIFKDDHLHPAIQTVNPTPNSGKSGSNPGSQYECNDKDGNPIEKPFACPVQPTPQKQPMNPYYKCKNEQRPYLGPGTPQNNKIALEQSGWQVLSHSGHTMRMDDSVDQPKGIPNWEQGSLPFDFGCTDIFTGSTNWESATGHIIEMNDKEEKTNSRGKENYIRIMSAMGNKIELNDHTLSDQLAGEDRGIHIQSTSRHSIDLVDESNVHGSNNRCGQRKKIIKNQNGSFSWETTTDSDGSQEQSPINRATKAYVRIRSGYGLEIALNDCLPQESPGDQEKTINQNIQIYCPQITNEERGPHIMRFQEKPSGPGQIMLLAGGDYICRTYDAHVTMVGDKDKNPTNKITQVSQHTVIQTEKYYYNKADVHIFNAKKMILLMAGEDCKSSSGDECVPCVWPVLCLSPKGVTISDRVYVSASKDADCANITQLVPFHKCEPWESSCPSVVPPVAK